MIFESSVIRDKLKGLDPGWLLRIQIIAHAFLIVTGFASSIVFALLLSNKEALLVTAPPTKTFPSLDSNSSTQDPRESPVQNNDLLVMTTMMVILIHSSLTIMASSIFMIANRMQFRRSDMVLSTRVQVGVLSLSVFITFMVIVIGGVLGERMENSISGAVPNVLINGLPVYLTILGASILTQGCLITILYVGRFHFTQLIEEDEETGQRVRLEIQANASPQVNVQLPSDNKTLKQVKNMLTLPGRDRLASLRSLHAYDPVNSSPGLYAVPLTPFDCQTGTWSVIPTPETTQQKTQQKTQQENEKFEEDSKTVNNSEDYFAIDENNEDSTIDFSLQVPNNTL